MIDIIVQVFHAMTASDWWAILALAGLFLLAGYMPRILGFTHPVTLKGTIAALKELVKEDE